MSAGQCALRAIGLHENVIAVPQSRHNRGAYCEGQAQGLNTKGAMPMITLKSHARGRKPETTVIGETMALWDRLPWERVHLRHPRSDNHWCVMCQTVTGPNRPWMDKIDRWQEHPMRCIREA